MRSDRTNWLLVVACLLQLAVFARAANYYVAQNGTDDASCGSISHPCASIAVGIQRSAVSTGNRLMIGPGTFALTATVNLWNASFSLLGAGSASTTIECAPGMNSAFNVTSSAAVFDSLAISNCVAPSAGGGIWAQNSTVFLGSVVMQQCSAGLFGGAIYAVSSQILLVSGGFLTNNVSGTATSGNAAGGAVYVGTNSSLQASGTYFIGNFAGTSVSSILTGAVAGGAVAVAADAAVSSAIILTDCVFVGNGAFAYTQSTVQGGALSVASPVIPLVLEGCSFSNSIAESAGVVCGAAVCTLGPITVSNSDFTGQSLMGSQPAGGALGILSSAAQNVLITGSNFTRNSVSVAAGGAQPLIGGGAIALIGGTISGCQFTGNSLVALPAAGQDAYGGGAVSVGKGMLDLTGSQFDSNSIMSVNAYGGAVFVTGNASISDCYFTGNTLAVSANGVGGAVAVVADMQMTGCTFRNNSIEASQIDGAAQGGAVGIVVGEAEIANSTFVLNRVSTQQQGVVSAGGAVASAGWRLGLTNCSFVNNSAHALSSLASGGAVAATEVGLSLCVFQHNSAVCVSAQTAQGGAVAASFVACSSTAFDSNLARSSGLTAFSYGGAVYAQTMVLLELITFTRNVVSGAGGADALGAAVACGSSGPCQRLDVRNSSFAHNTLLCALQGATCGGAALYTGPGSVAVVVFGSSFTSNSGLVSGGAILQGTAICSGGALALQQVQLVGNTGEATGINAFVQGGAVFCIGSLTVTDSEFTSNIVTCSQQGLSAQSAALYVISAGTIERSVFTNNSVIALAGTAGTAGAVFGVLPLNFTDCEFTGNSVIASSGTQPVSGGACLVGDGSQFVRCSFFGNYVSSLASGSAAGGAISSAGGLLRLSECIFTGNNVATAVNSPGSAVGGAVATSMLIAENTNFTGNLCYAQGTGDATGGAVSAAANATVSACNFEQNFVASFSGGGLARGGALHVGGVLAAWLCSFDQDAAVSSGIGNSYGGAIYTQSGSLSDSTLTNTRAFCIGASGSAAGGGAAAVQSLSVFGSSFTNCTVIVLRPTSFGLGGALYLIGDSSSITNCLFIGNTAHAKAAECFSYGGAVYFSGVSLWVNNATMVGNSALSNYPGGASYAGAVYVSQGNANVTLSRFIGNSAQATVQGAYSNGGALALLSGLASVTACEFTGNSLTALGGSAAGGAIYAAGSLSMSGSNVQQNVLKTLSVGLSVTGQASGGGLYATGTVTFVQNCTFGGNILDATTALGGDIQIHASLAAGSVTLDNVVFRDGGASTGGCVGAAAANISITNCLLSSCRTQDNGGALWLSGNDATVANCDIRDASAGSFGGGVYFDGGATGSLAIRNTNVSLCEAFHGAGIYIASAATVAVSDGVLVGNTADVGAGLHLEAPVAAAAVARMRITDNNTPVVNGDGAGIFAAAAAVTLSESIVERNAAGGAGAALFVESSVVTVAVAQTQLLNNTAVGDGGGVYGKGAANVSLSDCIVSSNSGEYGGGIAALDYVFLTLANTTVSHNNASRGGGGIYWNSVAPVLSGATLIVGNTALFGTNQATPPASVALSVLPGDGCGVTNQIAEDVCGLMVASGCRLSLALAVQDAYGQVVAQTFVLTQQQAQAASLPAASPSSLSSLSLSLSQSQSQSSSVRARGSAVGDASRSSSSASADTLPVAVSAASSASTATCTAALGAGCSDACISGGGSIVLAAGTGILNVTVGGAAGARFCTQFSVGAGLYTNQVSPRLIAGTITNCSAGYQSPSSVCGECQRCSAGSYNLNGNGMCVPCARPAANCYANYVWPASSSFLVYDNVTGTATAFACEANMCSQPCSALASPNDCYAQLQNSSIPPVLCHTASAMQLGLGAVPAYCAAVTVCQAGRTGFMCGACEDGYSEWDGKCVDCAASSFWLVVVLVLLYWLYIVVVHMLLAGRVQALSKTLVYFAQMSIVVLGRESTVGVWLSIFTGSLTGPVNLCPFPRSFYGQFLQQMVMIPLSIAIVLLSWLVTKAVAHRTTGIPLDTLRWLVRPLTSLTVALYTPTALAVLDMLRCRTVANEYVIYAAPSLRCSGDPYAGYQIAAIVLGVGLTAAPFALLYFLWRYRARLDQRSTLAALGFYYECYRRDLFFWEVYSLLRRAALMLLSLIEVNDTKNYVLALVCAVIAAVEIVAAPLQTRVENAVHQGALAVLALLAFTNASSLFTDYTAQLVIAINVALGVMLLGVVVAFVYISRRFITLQVRQILAAMRLRARSQASGRPMPTQYPLESMEFMGEGEGENALSLSAAGRDIRDSLLRPQSQWGAGAAKDTDFGDSQRDRETDDGAQEMVEFKRPLL